MLLLDQFGRRMFLLVGTVGLPLAPARVVLPFDEHPERLLLLARTGRVGPPHRVLRHPVVQLPDRQRSTATNRAGGMYLEAKDAGRMEANPRYSGRSRRYLVSSGRPLTHRRGWRKL